MIDPVPIRRNSVWTLAALLCVAGMLGCAGGLPRIDPTGQQLLIWPNEQTVVGPPSPFATAPPLPGTPQPIGPAAPQGGFAPAQQYAVPPTAAPPPQMFGNLQAPPAYSNPNPPGLLGGLLPQTQPPVVGPPVGPPVVGAPMPVGGTPVPVGGPMGSAVTAAPAAAALTVPPERVRILPARVLAPVGSEVVLRAGVCNSEGYLIASQRIDWMLARSGAGQFVTLNNRDELHPFRFPRDKPRKVDNWFAIGKTSTYPTCLHRGTADPRDDVQVHRGESWITVSSASEGTSHVTAYSPIVENWPGRTASATIYWVDAQWVFPPSATVQPGATHVLTTTVSRRSDGAPLAGWIVRYEVATSSGASLGYDATQTMEARTDANGRASVEVSPANAGDGMALIHSTLLRPAESGPAGSPQLEIARSAATITWGRGAAAAPPPTTGVPFQPTPFEPAEPSPGDTPSLGPDPGRAVLDIQIRPLSPPEVNVGDYARFDVTITNRGDAYARNIMVRDEFDAGLSHVQAEPGASAIEYGRTPDLAPGGQHSIELSLGVERAGRLCHTARATAEGGATASASSCVVGVPPAPVAAQEPQVPQAPPSIELTLVAPRRQYVGERAEVRIVVRNTGTVPVTNLVVVNQFARALDPAEAEIGHQWVSDNSLAWQVPELGVGQQRQFRILFNCVAPDPSALNAVEVTAAGGLRQYDERRIEILQPPPGALPAGPPQSQQPPETLQLSIRSVQNPAEVGRRGQLMARVENRGASPQRDVAVSLFIPDGMSVDPDGIESRQQSTLENRIGGQLIVFTPIAELRVNERVDFLITVDVRREGDVQIQGELTAAGYPGSRAVRSEVIRINPRLE